MDELAWLAFFAQQHGWDDLAQRIRDEVHAAEQDTDELRRRGTKENDEQAA